MPRPILNVSETIGGITLHRDLDDAALLHYRPLPRWSALATSAMGNKLTSLSGDLQFDLTSAEFAQLKAAFPQGRFAPLVPKSVNGDAASTVVVNAPHSLTVRVISSLPFPQVVMSATLRRSELNHDQLLAAITASWSDRSLIRGSLEFVIEMRRVAAAYDVQIQPAAVVGDLVSATGGRGWGAPADIWEAVAGTALRRSSDFVKPVFDQGVPGAEDDARKVLEESIHRDFVINDGHIFAFDGGQAVSRYRIRDAVEFDSRPPSLRLTKSSTDELRFKCF